MINFIESNVLLSALQKSLNLLRATFRSNGKEGGWYHYLDSARPGPTASAVGLMAFYVCKVPFEHAPEVLRLLKSTQIQSSDPQKNGGWPISMTGDQPIIEATGWVARALGLSRAFLSKDAPDIGAVYQWLLKNQNPDHGWGSFYRQPSRVYLTSMALRALVTLDPYCEAVVLGQDWLLKNRSGNYPAWGATASSPPTVLHTAFVLMTLAELGADGNLSIVDNAYKWLEDHINTQEPWELISQVEDYDILYNDGPKEVKYQNSLPHFALPVAISALLFKYGINHSLVCDGLQTITASQNLDGYWENARNPARISIWAIWPFLQALHNAVSLPTIRPKQSITRVASALIMKPSDARAPILGLILYESARTIVSRILEHWSPLLLLLFVSGGLVLVSLDTISLREYLFSLIIPIVLIYIQFSLERRSKKVEK